MAKSPETPKILGSKVISQDGPFVTTRIWLEGKHPGGVVVNNGWNGDGIETVIDKVGLKPFETFWVGPKTEKDNFQETE